MIVRTYVDLRMRLKASVAANGQGANRMVELLKVCMSVGRPPRLYLWIECLLIRG